MNIKLDEGQRKASKSELYKAFLSYEYYLLKKYMFPRIQNLFEERGIDETDYSPLLTMAMAAHIGTTMSQAQAIFFVIRNWDPESNNESLQMKITAAMKADAGENAVSLKRAVYLSCISPEKAALIEYQNSAGNQVVRKFTDDEMETGYKEYYSSVLQGFLASECRGVSKKNIKKLADIVITETLCNFNEDKSSVFMRVFYDFINSSIPKFVFDDDNITQLYNKKYNDNTRDNLQFAMDRLSSICMDKKSLSRLQSFLTFRLQTKDLKYNLKNYCNTYYNLLVHSDDEDQLFEFSKLLGESLNLNSNRIITYGNGIFKKLFDGGEKELIEETVSGYDMVVLQISDDILCYNSPLNFGFLEKFKECEDIIRDFWLFVEKLVRSKPDLIVVLGMNENLYRNIKENSEIYYRLFGHHIKIDTMNAGKVYELCIRKLEESSFTLGKGFKDALKDYVYSIYDGADLQSYGFIVDLLNRLSSNYYSKIRETKNLELTVDCIPRYNSIKKDPEDIMAEINDLPGLKNVKNQMMDLYTRIQMSPNGNVKNPHHMLFTGNPGTGKTTVAEMMASLLYSLGITKTNKLVSISATELIAPAPGIGAGRLKSAVDDALGGVLFIDEAYVINNSDKVATELTGQLLKDMEEHADEFVLIMAGYGKEMDELLDFNAGLKDRFRHFVEFPDYTVEELVNIFEIYARKEGFKVDDSAREAFKHAIKGKMVQVPFSNARAVRNILNEVIDIWSKEAFKKKGTGNTAVRESFGNDNTAPETDRILTREHFISIIPDEKKVDWDSIIGLENIKKRIDNFESEIKFRKHRESLGIVDKNSINYHMLFLGNPGTGKTVIAKRIADIMYAIGILKNNKVTVLERKDLVGQYVGQTEEKAMKVLEKGKGGVIFIDEAYALLSGDSSNDYGARVIEQLLTFMEDNKKDTLLIFAGYEREMKAFVDSNPGISSRIGFTFCFEDYSKEELTKMFLKKCESNSFTVDDEALNKASDVIEYFMPMKNFGNGRFVDRLYDQTYIKRSERGYKKKCNDITVKDIPSVKEVIDRLAGSDYMYDPASLTKESKKRTVVHEIGHAIASCISGVIPDKISVKNQIGSLGRVSFKARSGNMTEDECLNEIVTLLSGRNAERAIFGNSATGCSSDFKRAKKLAEDMVSEYAMGVIGVTKPEDFLLEADKKSSALMDKYRDFINDFSDELLNGGEISGKDFNKRLKGFKVKK